MAGLGLIELGRALQACVWALRLCPHQFRGAKVGRVDLHGCS